MYYLKGCPRCGGGLYESRDIYDTFLACIQCGHYASDDETEVLRNGRSELESDLRSHSAVPSLGAMVG